MVAYVISRIEIFSLFLLFFKSVDFLAFHLPALRLVDTWRMSTKRFCLQGAVLIPLPPYSLLEIFCIHVAVLDRAKQTPSFENRPEILGFKQKNKQAVSPDMFSLQGNVLLALCLTCYPYQAGL